MSEGRKFNRRDFVRAAGALAAAAAVPKAIELAGEATGNFIAGKLDETGAALGETLCPAAPDHSVSTPEDTLEIADAPEPQVVEATALPKDVPAPSEQPLSLKERERREWAVCKNLYSRLHRANIRLRDRELDIEVFETRTSNPGSILKVSKGWASDIFLFYPEIAENTNTPTGLFEFRSANLSLLLATDDYDGTSVFEKHETFARKHVSIEEASSILEDIMRRVTEIEAMTPVSGTARIEEFRRSMRDYIVYQ